MRLQSPLSLTTAHFFLKINVAFLSVLWDNGSTDREKGIFNMAYDLRASDLTQFGHAISDANTVEEAKAIFIDMVNNFDFKSKQKLYIMEATVFNKSKRHFVQWAWNIILSSQGLGVK